MTKAEDQATRVESAIAHARDGAAHLQATLAHHRTSVDAELALLTEELAALQTDLDAAHHTLGALVDEATTALRGLHERVGHETSTAEAHRPDALDHAAQGHHEATDRVRGHVDAARVAGQDLHGATRHAHDRAEQAHGRLREVVRQAGDHVRTHTSDGRTHARALPEELGRELERLVEREVMQVLADLERRVERAADAELRTVIQEGVRALEQVLDHAIGKLGRDTSSLGDLRRALQPLFHELGGLVHPAGHGAGRVHAKAHELGVA